jgi:hypothetical protein
MSTNSLTYTITTENATSIKLPSDFGQSILVMDSIFWPYNDFPGG